MLNTDGGSIYGARGSDLTGTRVHHNWIYNCTVGAQWRNSGPAPWDWQGSHDAIYYDQGSGPTTNDHNVLWLGAVADVFIQPLYGRHTRWINNTLATTGPLPREAYTTYYTTDKCLIRNNIMVMHINMQWGAAGGPADATNNVLPTGNGNAANGYYQGPNNTYSNAPLFVGGATDTGLSYQIQSGSPARNIGVHIPGITDGYEGAAPDAGAYEYGVAWPGGDPGYVEVVDGSDYIIDNEDMTYTGVGWVHTSGQGYNPAPTFSQSYSPTSAAYVEAAFSGTQVKLYAEERFNHGIVEVKIDGVRQDCDPGTGGTQDCDLYVVGSTNNATLIGTWATAAGAHTFRLTKVGGNARCTGGCNINIDYLEVTP